MRIKYISFLISALLLGGTTSCNDWLDIEQNTEKKADNMFDNYSGFKGALSGCYSDLASTSLYGMNLTMSHVDALAGMWYIDQSWNFTQTMYECDALTRHEYGSSYSETAIKRIYGALYNTILEANTVLKGCREHAQNIDFPESRPVIEGEAYAIRALCHLDILRLFGQLPKKSTVQVSLPYSETTSLENVPEYYTYQEYIGKLESDLNKALELMKDNDPVCHYKYEQLYYMDYENPPEVILNDEFMTNRRFRMNYWAVKALQARMYMYIGETEKAHNIALEVINAKTTSGESPAILSSNTDYGTGKTDFASSSECLFALHKGDLYDVSVPLLAGGELTGEHVTYIEPGEMLVLDENWFKELFKGANTAADIRYNKMWSKTITNQKKLYPSIRKYYVYKTSSDSKGAGVIPILRLSEMYLIAVETASSVAEANRLYSIYMESKGVPVENLFTSLDLMEEELRMEYLREFFAEGQMFYYYKRHNVKNMWSKENITVTESDYLLPLPNTEFNSNKK